MPITAKSLAASGAIALAAALSACGKPELPPASPGPLAGCRLEDDGQVRTWTCGELIALELAADPATPEEARVVLEDFAKGFVDARAARTDTPWRHGAESFPSVRLEGTTAEGVRFTAQMIVISRPDHARVVQCASKSPVAPCEPILEHLVKDGEAAARVD